MGLWLAFIAMIFGQLMSKCNHDHFSKQFDLTKSLKNKDRTPSDDRLLQNSSWRKIRILADFTYFSSNSTTKKVIQHIFNDHLIPRIQLFLSVKGPMRISDVNTTDCHESLPFSTKYSTEPTDTDLILFIKSYNEGDDVLAMASACSVDQVTYRPNVGFILINLKYLNFSPNGIEKFTYTLLHEIHHILIFSSGIFNLLASLKPSINLVQSFTQTTSSGTFQNQTGVISQNVIAVGKNHFGCSNLTRIPTENEGGAGSARSHWEKAYLGNELMTAQMTGKPILSNFTLALLQDSGLYDVDYSKAERLQWGYQKGCKFYDFSCNSSFPEYCTSAQSKEEEIFCSEDYTSKTLCLKSTFSDQCNINEHVSGLICNKNFTISNTTLHEVPGKNSRCFQTTYAGFVSAPGCYMSSCVNGQVHIQVNNQKLICTSKGNKVSTDAVVITCPDPADFCKYFNQECPNDCNGAGRCMFNGCFCNIFNTGSDCSDKLPCNDSLDVCQAMSAPVQGQIPDDKSIGRAFTFLCLLLINFVFFN